MMPRALSVLCLLAAIATGVGCHEPSVENGATLFQKNCSGCHAQQPDRNNAPSLSGYFERKPRPTARQVRRIIKDGKDYMPPFGRRLSTDDVDDLIAYLKAHR